MPVLIRYPAIAGAPERSHPGLSPAGASARPRAARRFPGHIGAALLVAVAAIAGVLASTAACADGISSTRLAQLPQGWRDDRGESFELTGLVGHRVILTMAYASCHQICPQTIDGLRRLQKKLDARGESADIVVVGYDPENEDPATWHQYRASHHLARANWHFLSGSRDGTERLARQLGFEFWKYDEHVMHDSRVLIFDSQGRLASVLGPDTRQWLAAL